MRSADMRSRPGLFGSDLDLLEFAVVEPDRLRESVKRDLVEARAVNDERSLDAQRTQGLGDRPKQLGFGDAEQLHLRPRRVQAGTEQVHDRSNLSARRTGPACAMPG